MMADLKGGATMNIEINNKENQNISEISEEKFVEIIEKLYFMIQKMPKNAKVRHLKNLKISEYEDYFNL